MKRCIAHLILIVYLVVAASSPDAMAIGDSCADTAAHKCTCITSAPHANHGSSHQIHKPGHQIHHTIVSVPQCSRTASCCHLKPANTPREPLLVQTIVLSAKPMVSAALPADETQPPFFNKTRTHSIYEHVRPGPVIPAYLQNRALLC